MLGGTLGLGELVEGIRQVWGVKVDHTDWMLDTMCTNFLMKRRRTFLKMYLISDSLSLQLQKCFFLFQVKKKAREMGLKARQER